MSKQDLKNELQKLIDEIEDEQILNLLKEDLLVYGKRAPALDYLSDLSEEDKAEIQKTTHLKNQHEPTLLFTRCF